MKFKQQEEEALKVDNSFLNSITDLIILCKQFIYAMKSMDIDNKFCSSICSLRADCEILFKLAVCLDKNHKMPTITVQYAPAESIKDLKTLEEKYYNMLKEIANNALEENNAEVFSYLSNIILGFKHYFCTLNEDDDSGETSS